MPRKNLVDESHNVIGELSKIRKDFHSRKLSVEEVKQSIGLFNTTSRAIGTAIRAEQWEDKKKAGKNK